MLLHVQTNSTLLLKYKCFSSLLPYTKMNVFFRAILIFFKVDIDKYVQYKRFLKQNIQLKPNFLYK
jgi:hypothetical protein